ncbi:sensor histidine kinase [Pedosphaera parvula]|nr:sensor histidine kinase [Pedosphaera parvula]
MIATSILLPICLCTALAMNGVGASGKSDALKIQSLTVDGKQVSLQGGQSKSLGLFPESVSFGFGSTTNSGQKAVRIRYKLEGYDVNWHEGLGEMYVMIRFFNDAGDQIAENRYKVNGESMGWNGSLTTSPLAHRRETIVVPRQASRFWAVISSGGPPATVGIYVVANLVVSKSSGNSASVELIHSPFDQRLNNGFTNQTPPGWMPDGNHSSMAKIVDFGQHPQTKAFAILDEDPISHAEWHMIKETAPAVTPGDNMVVEWDEMYSIGMGDFLEARYEKLPVGHFLFRVSGVDVMGNPTGEETSLAVLVPQPFWKTYWFLGAAFSVLTAAMIGSGRYFVWQRMQREMLRLKHQGALEQERLRIAHDIHDDLGARVTQISLVSAMAQDNPTFPEKARADFDRISKMSRELVAALYETVWAVNPENDNLDALGNYICQMVNQLCERTQLRCRFHVLDLPHEVQVSSQTRHNISMAVKEAVHNVIKHARASEVTIRMAFEQGSLTVTVQDDGCGFQPHAGMAGNGLTNMKQRLKNIGGHCLFESKTNHGTTVSMRLFVKPADQCF